MTFQEFQDQVSQWCPKASEVGYFQDVDNLMPGRVLYTWHGTHGGAAMYDSSDAPTFWGIDNGRGRMGRGGTLTEADQDEKRQYDASF